jgi:hypothetical protein
MRRSEPITEELFHEWTFHPITKRLMELLQADYDFMKEGWVRNSFADESEMRGRARAISLLLNIEFKDFARNEIKEERTLND